MDNYKSETNYKILPKNENSENSVRVQFARLSTTPNLLNMDQGCADFMPPEHVTEALATVANVDNPSLHQYTRSYGHFRLVNCLSKLYSKLINRDINAETEILVTCGGHNALFLTIMSHIKPRDEIILIEPFFDCYLPMIELAGGNAKFIPLRYRPKGNDSTYKNSGDFVLDKNELESLFNCKTKAIILNTPNNPLGKVYTKKELTTIAELCQKWNVLCISDEVYEWMVYKPYTHIRIASLPNMWERTITIGSAGKTFTITGWKTGWIYGPANLLKPLIRMFDTCVAAVNTPIQEAIAIIFEKELELLETNPKESYLNSLPEELFKKKEFIMNCLNNKGIYPIDPQGGFFINADWSIMESQINCDNDHEELKDIRMGKWMVNQLRLLGIPLSAFYSKEHKTLASNMIRFCFIKQDEKLRKVEEILMKI